MTKPATTKPITIPRDLNCGDVIVDKDGNKHICQPVAMDGSCYENGRVWTAPDHITIYGRWFARDFNDTSGELACRIIRKASKPARVDRDADLGAECVRLIKRIARECAKRQDHKARKLPNHIWQQVSAIARRLGGEGE